MNERAHHYYATLAVLGIIIAVGFLVLTIAFDAMAQDEDEEIRVARERITFPIEELGNCASKEECRAYCAEEENREACMNYAEEHRLLPLQKIMRFKEKIQNLREKLSEFNGPGDCTSVRECRAYCSEEENKEECREFGARAGLLPERAALEAKLNALIRTVGGPGGCSTVAECRKFCSEEENKDECEDFAESSVMKVRERAQELKDSMEERREEFQEKRGEVLERLKQQREEMEQKRESMMEGRSRLEGEPRSAGHPFFSFMLNFYR